MYLRRQYLERKCRHDVPIPWVEHGCGTRRFGCHLRIDPDLVERAFGLAPQPAAIFLGDAFGVALEDGEDAVDGEAELFEHQDDVPKCYPAFLDGRAVTANDRHGVGGDVHVVRLRSMRGAPPAIGLLLEPGEVLLKPLARRQHLGIEGEYARGRVGAAPLLFLPAWIVHGARHAVRLRDRPRVTVGSCRYTQWVAERLVRLGIEIRLSKNPEVVIARRRLDRVAYRPRRRPPGALVGIAVRDQSEHRDSIFELAALLAGELSPHGSSFDVHVVPGVAVCDSVRDHALDDVGFLEAV